MALTITGRVMRSPDTAHAAEHVRQGGADEWRVTWLPGRSLTRDQAAAAMELAEAVGQMPADCDPSLYDDGFWSRADELADVLGMSGPDAVARASESPEDAADRQAGEGGDG
jgi:hypothetical protein